MYMMLTTIIILTMIEVTWCEIGHMLISRLFDHFVLLGYPSLQSPVSFFVFYDYAANTCIVKIPGTPCPDLEGQTQQGSRALVQEKPCKYQSYFVIMSKTSAHLVEQGESEC